MYRIFHEEFYNPSFHIFVKKEETLKESLHNKSLEECQMIAYLYQMRFFEELTKEELEKELYSKIISREHFLYLTYTSFEEQYELLEKLALHHHVRPEKIDYEYLMRLITLELVYLVEEDAIIYVRTYEDVYEAMKGVVFTKEENIEETRTLIEAIQSCLHLYGVLTHEEMKKMLQRYTGFSLSKEDYYKVLELCVIKGIALDYDEHFVGSDLIKRSTGLQQYYKVREVIKEDFYTPSVEIFKQYKAIGYYEKPDEYKELLVYLQEHFGMNEAYALLFMDDASINQISEDERHSLEELVDIYRLRFMNEQQRYQFYEMLDYFFGFLKLKKCKGYSIDELTKFEVYHQTLS